MSRNEGDVDDDAPDAIENEIARLMSRKPFVGFVIVLKSGLRVPVVARERIACGFGKVVVFPPGTPHEYFRTSAVAAIEVPEMVP